MDIKIRSERISDYNSIANVNYEAFLGWHPDNQYVSEPILVDLLRHNSMFDPELSLVAELNGKIIGHVLFSPFRFIVLGEEQLGAVLAPVAVMPEFQHKGIGSMLIEEGHKKARERGCAFSLLCGHVGYYPRFGYKTAMFSLSGSKVSINTDHFSNEDFSDRPVNGQDIPWILNAWVRQHGNDDLALLPGKNISEWSNHNLECRSLIVIKNNSILGYVRHDRSNPSNIKELLANSSDVQDILAYIGWKKFGKAQGEIHIAVTAEKMRLVLGNTDTIEVLDEHTAYKAFMIKILDQDSPISGYCEKAEKGLAKSGIIVFPPVFDVDDGRTD
ncbi:MAG: N-acetyltransferase [Clostridiaceae bacterium]